MNSSAVSNSPLSTELEPWVILTRPDAGNATSQLAVWRIAGEPPQSALALFSERVAAERYAQQFCATPLAAAIPKAGAPVKATYRIEQFTSLQLLAVLAECYRQGMRCAALNPDGASAQRLFVLRDVLASAKQQLRSGGGLG